MTSTPLHSWHVSRGATMTDFAGWEMPLYYSAIQQEHHAVRNAAGLFDVSHMGRLRIGGPNALELTQAVFSNDVGPLRVGQACYGLICTPSGGVMDDVIVYREFDGYLMVPNASNREAVLAWLEKTASDSGWSVDIQERTFDVGMIALQGPASASILKSLGAAEASNLRRFRACDATAGGIACRIARTGYTGEDGFELLCEARTIETLWRAIIEAGAPAGLLPAGLAARDSLRIEAGLPLYGHELGLELNPAYAGLERFIKMDKKNFIGKEAIGAATCDDSARYLAAFEMIERAVPRAGCPVLAGGETVGEVASGLFSPTLNKGLGMAFIQGPHNEPGSEIAVQIRKKKFQARVAPRPIYRRRKD